MKHPNRRGWSWRFGNVFRQAVLPCVLLTIVLVRPIGAVSQVWEKFSRPGYWQQYPDLAAAYGSSQYMVKNAPAIIPDETFEAFAGGYLARGGNPILITHDHPPLGRYFFAFSALAFDNVHTMTLILLIISTVFLFAITRMALGSMIWAILPVAVFINEPLFLEKLTYSPLPEVPQLFAVTMYMFIFLLSVRLRHPLLGFMVAALALGVLMSVRVFVIAGVMAAITVVFLFLHYRQAIVTYLVSLPFSLCILLLTYWRTIADGMPLIKVMGVQKYILAYHQSKFVLPFTVWDLLIRNRWHTWWGDWSVSSDPHWIPVWPVAGISMMVYILMRHRLRGIRSDVDFIALWSLGYLLFLSLGYSSTRYFLILLPFLYTVTVALGLSLWRSLRATDHTV